MLGNDKKKGDKLDCLVKDKKEGYALACLVNGSKKLMHLLI